MDLNGLPLHPLVVHATVVLIPLAAVVAVVHAVAPRWRWASRWPLVLSSAGALGAVLLAYFSGKDFLAERYPAERTSIVQLHEERGEVLLWVTVVFVVFALLAAWGLGGPSALASGRGGRTPHAPLIEWSLVSLLLILSVAVLLMTFQTGEAGARSVWGAG